MIRSTINAEAQGPRRNWSQSKPIPAQFRHALRRLVLRGMIAGGRRV